MNLDNIHSVAQKPHKSLENLFELLFSNDTSKLLLQVFSLSSPIEFPVYSTGFLEIEGQFIDESSTLNVIMEPFVVDLGLEIGQRVKSQAYFSEAEIWRVLLQGITCLSELHLKGRAYGGSLALDSFVLLPDDDTFTVKMITPEVFMLNEKNQKESRQDYFTQEGLKAVQLGKPQNEAENIENDVFHLGLALLEMSTFISISSCDDWDALSLNSRFLEKKLSIVESKYSKELAFLIKIMLSFDQRKRPKIKELAILIHKFDALNGFCDKKDISNFVRKELRTNICAKCINCIRKRKEEAIYGEDESSSLGNPDSSRRLFSDNDKEWLHIQQGLTKTQHARSVLKSIDNMNYG